MANIEEKGGGEIAIAILKEKEGVIVPPEPIIRYPWQENEAKPSLPEKRHDDNYKWTPTHKIEAAIMEAVFGKH